MAEYVEREAAVSAIQDSVLNKAKKEQIGSMTVLATAQGAVSRLPTADVVEVVRCKDCRFYYDKHYENEGEPPYIKRCCKYSNYTRQPNDFCSCGERKDGEEK